MLSLIFYFLAVIVIIFGVLTGFGAVWIDLHWFVPGSGINFNQSQARLQAGLGWLILIFAGFLNISLFDVLIWISIINMWLCFFIRSILEILFGNVCTVRLFWLEIGEFIAQTWPFMEFEKLSLFAVSLALSN